MSEPKARPVRLVVLAEDSVPHLAPNPDLEICVTTGDKLPADLREAEALLVWDFAARGLADAWSSANDLRWVHVNSAGVDHVLFEDLAASDVTVTNTAGVLDQSLAEYVVGLVLALLKDLPGTLERQRSHLWEHRPTRRLAGSRALVVGMGGIGRAIAHLLTALGVSVDGLARTSRPGDADVGLVHAAEDFTLIVGRYDVVVLAAPLTANSRGIVGREALEAMRTDALLVNVGRGALIDTQALLDVLASGRLLGVALDAFEQEPLPAGHPLWSAPRTLISPHMSGDYLGWEEDLLGVFTENLARFTSGRRLRNVVDKSMGYVPRGPT